jgi:methylated-DNA-[protein]-cysteine S-methyltransferase
MMTSFDPAKHGPAEHIAGQRPDPTTNHVPDPDALLAALSADLTAGEADALARLHERLVVEAGREGTLDVGYRTLDTPVGALLLAATEQGLVRVAYPSEDHDAVLDKLGRLVSPRILRAPRRLDGVAGQLEQYFAGRRTIFEVPLDLRLSTGFRRMVLSHLSEIGYGQTASYAQMAAAAGNPKAVRAAGTACATNPLPVVLPCHRVIRSDGSVGQYVGGPEAKRALLRLERAVGGAA